MSALPTRSDIKIIAMVGKIVTKGNRQFKVHSVEGRTWYAFNNDRDETVIDMGFPALSTMEQPLLTLLPDGAKIGQGFAVEAFASDVSRGVCLTKSWI